MISDKEVRRQFLHILCGLFLILLVYFNLGQYVIYLALFVVLLSFIEIKYRVPIYDYVLRKFERPSETEGFRGQGLVFFLLGSAVVVAFFSRDVAMTSIIVLAFGDSISRLLGPSGLIKHPFNNERFVEGLIYGWIVATFAAWMFVPLIDALIGSGFAMFAESLNIKIKGEKIDDNLLIPIICAVVLTFINLI